MLGLAGVSSNVYCTPLRISVVEALRVLDDHFFDVLTARTCHGHPLPCNDITGTCVSEADATSVFAIGDFEYEYVSPSPSPSPSSLVSRRLLTRIQYTATSGTQHKTHQRTIRFHLVKAPSPLLRTSDPTNSPRRVLRRACRRACGTRVFAPPRTLRRARWVACAPPRRARCRPVKVAIVWRGSRL